jgi:dihydrodipicolinate synthase/N-acetylneuraminate lyase
MVVAPRAVPLGTAELTAFFEAICRNVKIPVMIQDADFQGAGLPVRFFVEMAGRCPNLQFAKLENVLPGERCQEIIRQSSGRIKVLYGWGGLRLFDGLVHGAAGIMPGPALIEVYAQVLRLYEKGSVDEAKTWFYRILPFLVFSLDHLELFIQMEKRLLVRLGVIPQDRMREPTLSLDEAYLQMIEELVGLAVTLTRDLRRATDR